MSLTIGIACFILSGISIDDAVFWQADDEIITKETAVIGVLNAANELKQTDTS